MKKQNSKNFDYPIVVRRVVNDLVFSIPDLGYFKHMNLKPFKSAESANTSNSATTSFVDLNPEFQKEFMKQMESAWAYVGNHMATKKWLPNPSTFKQSVQKGEEDYSLPEFVEKLKEFMTISENTVRREIKRGKIQCYQTEGGHRRIPFSELKRYVEGCKTQRHTESEPAAEL